MFESESMWGDCQDILGPTLLLINTQLARTGFDSHTHTYMFTRATLSALGKAHVQRGM